MRGATAKALRRKVYGDFSIRVRQYEWAYDKKGTPTHIVTVGLRRRYQAAKHSWKKGEARGW